MSLKNPATRKKVRFRLWVEQGAQCAYCGVLMTPDEGTFDHINPRSRGGSNAQINIVLVCNNCNQKKGDLAVNDPAWEIEGLVHINPRIDF